MPPFYPAAVVGHALSIYQHGVQLHTPTIDNSSIFYHIYYSQRGQSWLHNVSTPAVAFFQHFLNLILHGFNRVWLVDIAVAQLPKTLERVLGNSM
jgi:hypothetical protein